jgi:hypothetical protein
LGYVRKRSDGYGKVLIEAVEKEAKKNKKGVAVLSYDHDFWFMTSSFFKKLGYKEMARQGNAVIMLKAFEPVDPPVMHKSNYQPQLIQGKVVVEAFWNPICLTSLLEIHRVREVCAECGDKVILNEFNCGDKDILDKYRTSRALFINGKPKDWGYAAPRDELKKEIERALEENRR